MLRDATRVRSDRATWARLWRLWPWIFPGDGGRIHPYPAQGDAIAPEKVTRRRADTVAVDVAGFSRPMGADEKDTLTQLKAHWAALVAIRGRQSVDRVGAAVELVVIPL